VGSSTSMPSVGSDAVRCLKSLRSLRLFKSCKVYPVTVIFLRCHHGMERSQVADGGDGLQMYKAGANMLDSRQGVLQTVCSIRMK
jgi:hypothetical protein